MSTSGHAGDQPAIRISGNPTAEEVAALVVALDALAAADAAARRPVRRPAWQYAARVEAVSARIVRSPADIGRAEDLGA